MYHSTTNHSTNQLKSYFDKNIYIEIFVENLRYRFYVSLVTDNRLLTKVVLFSDSNTLVLFT